MKIVLKILAIMIGIPISCMMHLVSYMCAVFLAVQVGIYLPFSSLVGPPWGSVASCCTSDQDCPAGTVCEESTCVIENYCDRGLRERCDDDGDSFTEVDDDCDDDNPNIHPGASDIPNNGIDEDCNHVIDG